MLIFERGNFEGVCGHAGKLDVAIAHATATIFAFDQFEER
ncbi:MAG: hypothetical protein QOH24_1778 [Verrucomicrobiota bacterium]